MPGSVGRDELMSTPLPQGIALLGEGAEAFLLVLAVVKGIDSRELALGDAVHGILEAHRLGRARHLLDGGEDQRRAGRQQLGERPGTRSEEHTSELQSLMRISYAVFCLKKKKN